MPRIVIVAQELAGLLKVGVQNHTLTGLVPAPSLAEIRGVGGQMARDRLGRLCRYVLRPPVADERLRRPEVGDTLLALERRWSDGTTHLRFTPVELLERLAVLIPRTVRLAERRDGLNWDRRPRQHAAQLGMQPTAARVMMGAAAADAQH